MRHVLHTDGNWVLSHDDDHVHVTHWVEHQCPLSATGAEAVYRYHNRPSTLNKPLNEPCGKCGETCPDGMQGMLIAMMML